MSAIGIFTIAFMFTTPLRMIPTVVSSAIFPITSQEWAKKEKKRLNNLISQALRYSYMASIPMLFVFIFFSREFILLFTTPEYLAAVNSFRILAVGYLLFGIASIVSGVLYYTDKPKLFRNINICSGIINLFLSIILIPFLGIFGASISFLISGMFRFAASFHYSYQYLKFSLVRFDFAKVVLCSAIMLSVLFIMRQINETLAWIIVSIIFSAVVYFACLLGIKFFKPVDIRILREMEKKMPKKFKSIIKAIINIISKFSK